MVRLWLGFKSWAGQHHKQDILNEAKEYQQLVSFIYYEKAEALQISTPALRSVDCQASFCTELNSSLVSVLLKMVRVKPGKNLALESI